MQGGTTFEWIRSHKRIVAIVLALAMVFAIVVSLATAPSELAAEDSALEIAGPSWSYSVSPPQPIDPKPFPGGGFTPNGPSWS